MEKKTIGGFIAALRKANGMTQKELAEKLNVSDKTISRWERDDGAPDLSAIPVIAEIFGVTCDELLRGERKPVAEQLSSKGEKQRQRILAVGLSKYKTRTFISMGISLLGLIAAMIGNFGFLRAYIGFLVGAIFYLASVVCQAIFVNSAFLTVADEELEKTEVGQFKRGVVYLAEWSIGLAVVLTGVSLPLVVFAYDTYVGITAGTWFLQGILFGILTFVVYAAVCYLVNGTLLRKGVYCLEEKAERIYLENRARKRKCAAWTVGALVCTCILHILLTETISVTDLSDGIRFDDYESFVNFMEKDISYSYNDSYTTVTGVRVESVAEPADDITYYDRYGNEISEEEALRRELTDGEGNVVCEYMDRNETVVSIRYSDRDGNLLPITVITHDALRGGRAKRNLIHAGFCVIYLVEAVTGIVVYWKKRVKK